MTVRRNVLLGLNGALVCMFGLQLTLQSYDVYRLPSRPASEATAVTAATVPPKQVAKIGSNVGPLFRARGGHSAEKKEPDAPKVERPFFRLVGILHGEGERLAVISANKGDLHRLGIGQEYSGWRLVETTARSATFNRQGRVEKLTFADK